MDKTFQRILLSIGFFLIISGFVFASNTIIRSTNSEIRGNFVIYNTLSNKTYVLPGNATDLKNKLESASEGDTIYIPKGLYEFNEDPGSTNYLIDISTNNLTIQGEGFSTEIFFNFENSDADRNFIALRGNDLLIKDLYIRGRQTDGVANADQSGTSLALTGVGGQVSNLFFMDGGHCLYYANAEYQKANSLTFYNCEQPLAIVDNSKGIVVSDLTATTKIRNNSAGWIQRAIVLDRSKDIALSNLYVNNASSDGLVLFGYNSSNSVGVTVNNFIYNGTPTSVGIQSWGYKDVVINNYVSRNANYGIYFQTRNHSTGDVDNIEDWRVSNFEIFGNGTNKGIYFGSGFTGFNTTIKNIKLSNGEIKTATGTPVRFLDENSDYYNITFNNVRIVSTGDNGIRIKKSFEGLSLINCDIDANTYSINNEGVLSNTRIFGTKLNVDSNPTITNSAFGLILFQGITIGNVEESPIFTSGIKTDEITAENTEVTILSDLYLDTDKLYTSQSQFLSEGGSTITIGDVDGAGIDKNLYLRSAGQDRIRILKNSTIDFINIFGSMKQQFDGDEFYLAGVGGDGSGKVVCVKADQNLGTCTDQPGAGGTCTCT